MEINPKSKRAYELWHEGILALSRAEQYGIKIDINYCNKMIRKLEKRIEQYISQLKETKLGRRWKHIYGEKTNFNSDYQLSNILFKHMGLKSEKETDGGRYSTDNEVLETITEPGIEFIIGIRKWGKVKGTYFENILNEQVDGILHPFFNLHLVRTFRSSSDRPNFQNIPKRDEEQMQAVRRAFIPRDGNKIIELDYAGIEVAISACYHQDPNMIKYINDKNTDMHRDMAIQIYKLNSFDKKCADEKKLRYAAKNGFVFPQFYGDYWRNCANTLWKLKDDIILTDGTPINIHLKKNKIGTFDKFQEHIQKVEEDFWENRFKIYNKWKKNIYWKYQKKGYIDFHTGFRCSGVMNQKEVCNYPIQGSAFHCLLWSFIQLDKTMQEENWNSRLIGQIHDAIVLDIDPKEEKYVLNICKKIMMEDLPKAWPWIIVPLTIEADATRIDEPWSEKKGIKIE